MSDPFTRRKTQPVLATHVLKKKGDGEANTASSIEIVPSEKVRLTYLFHLIYDDVFLPD